MTLPSESPNSSLYPLKSTASKITNKALRYQYGLLRQAGIAVSDLTPKLETNTDLVQLFRKSKQEAVQAIQNGHLAFAWKLHDSDGRGPEFQGFDSNSWYRWLGWYRFHHFRWDSPTDSLIPAMRKSLDRVGCDTWSRLFRRYPIHWLKQHDFYSLPDVYYISKLLGRIPRSAIDVGAGWGRMGMAWSALGVPTIGVSDSIEQPYLIQNQYLSSIPGNSFKETLLEKELKMPLDFTQKLGLLHFPLWDVLKIRSQSVEVLSAIQVLREVSDQTLSFLFSEVTRILIPGGLFYIRDNDLDYKTAVMHNTKIIPTLLGLGFEVCWKSSLQQGRDIHGVPIILRWKGPSS